MATLQDHARGLLTGPNVNKHLYDLMEESLDYNSTFTYLTGARQDIETQRDEVFPGVRAAQACAGA